MTDFDLQLAASLIESCVVLAAIVQATLLVKQPRTSFHRAVGAVLFLAALSLAADTLGLIDISRTLVWRRIALSGDVLLPGVLGFVVLAFLDLSTAPPSRSPWYSRAWSYGGLGLGLIVYLWWYDTSESWTNRVTGETGILVGPVWQVCAVFILLGTTVALSRFEQIYRQLNDSARYQSKLCFVGLGTLVFYQIYQSGHLLLDPAIESEHIVLRSLTLGVAVLLMLWGWRRSRLQVSAGKIKVSAELAYGSLSIILIGLYLVGIGSIWYWVKTSDFPGRSLAAGSLGFLAFLFLALVFLSRSWRIRARQFLSKHVIRSKHDYRAKWLEVTDSFEGARSTDEILDQLLAVLAKTFPAGLMSVWIRYESDGQYHRIRTLNPEHASDPLNGESALIGRLQETDRPLAVGQMPSQILGEPAVQRFLSATHAEICVPMKVQGRMSALMVLGVQDGVRTYESDDIELLRMIAHHVGVLLSQARLAEKAAASAELEAFHRFSAFCLHDIKNLAARLSLVVQNAEVHGANPEFQRSAMQVVAKTVDRMTLLMTKLSARSWEESGFEDVDVCAIIRDCLQSDALSMAVTVRSPAHEGLTISGDKLEFFQLVLNLLLNAQQAGASEATIEVARGQKGHEVVVLVSDNGPGIPEDQQRLLFQPLKTTKRQGLGVGLFQCRQIVERWGGSIRIRSMVGQGTCVFMSFPVGSSRERPS